MSLAEFEVDTLPRLVEQILDLTHNLEQGRFLWFRGTTCDQYELLPKLMRDGKSEEEIFDRERRLLTRFRQRSMAYWPAGYPQNAWEHLFAMQHYGLPTRLLDWTENVFVAAHFALAPKSVGHSSHSGDCFPVIWCVDPIGWNRSTPVLSQYADQVYVLTTADEDLDSYSPDTSKRRQTHPVAVFGAHNSNRIVAQRGTFFVWGKDPLALPEFPPSEKNLSKVRLSGDPAGLAHDLRNLGFSETTVFPELTSLAVELSRVEGWRP